MYGLYVYVYMCIYIYLNIIRIHTKKKIDETSISWPSLFIWSIISICNDIYSDNNDNHIQS